MRCNQGYTLITQDEEEKRNYILTAMVVILIPRMMAGTPLGMLGKWNFNLWVRLTTHLAFTRKSPIKVN